MYLSALRTARGSFVELHFKFVLGYFLWNFYRVLSGEAAGAEAAAGIFSDFCNAVRAEESEGIHADYLCDFLNGVLVRDEVLLAVDVRSEETLAHERRGGYPHVDLSSARMAEQLDDLRRGSSPYDTVVYKDNALALYRFADRVQLYPYGILAHSLSRLNERSADIAVLYEADSVGNTALLCEAERSVKSAVRAADDDVRLNRVLQRKIMTCTQTRAVDARTLDDRVGARKINELEHAHGAPLTAVGPNALNAVLVDNDYLSGFDIPDEIGASAVECAALGSHDIARAVRELTQTKRSEALRVACRNELFRRHYCK